MRPEPADPRNALLVECGHHFASGSADVALDVTLRFLGAAGSIPKTQLAAYGLHQEKPPQRVVEVTETVTAAGDDFRFLEDFRGMDSVAKAGTVIAHDDGGELRTPYDNCILIMPAEQPPRGTTAVRLGRIRS